MPERFLILLPGPEAEWAAQPEEQFEQAMSAHQQFQQDLTTGGHHVVAAGPLDPSDEAVSMRTTEDGSFVVKDGPYVESHEQVVGFYLVDTDNPGDLQECCERLALTGDNLEIRRIADSR